MDTVEIVDTAEAMQLATQELKRADHSIAVSLKYTRTVDVIKSIIERLINAIEYCFDALLLTAKEQGKVEMIPRIPRLKAEKARDVFEGDEMVADFCDFFLLLRRIDKAKFTRAQEYRRHVTMTADIDGGSIEVTIDIITDYFDRTREFFNYVARVVHGE